MRVTGCNITLKCVRRASRLVLAAIMAPHVVVQGAGAEAAQDDSAPLQFTVTYDAALAESYTGRVYIMFSASRHYEPRLGPWWFSNMPFLAMDVREWRPGETILITGGSALSYPGTMEEIPSSKWAVQAVMRLNRDSPEIGGAGDACSDVNWREFSGATGGNIDLRIDRIIAPEQFKETDRIKLVELRSMLLSEFHKRDIIMRAAVLLPKGYANEAEREYPAYYMIGGFSSDHRIVHWLEPSWDHGVFAGEIVLIVLDPLCYGGHHVFADSANNGPRGRAFVEEMLPHLERRFRLVSAPSARLLSGASSGGWASLWLQIAYPDTFGGVWAIAPDPVDFTDFQQINLYEDRANVYVDENGDRRPIAHFRGRPFGWYDNFANIEIVQGEGGQLRSFEWVFSPRGNDGLPMKMFDRKTGDVNRDVVEAWKAYDIRCVLESRWDELGPKLSGKINIFVGDQDNFYLCGAVVKLKATLEKLGSDAVIEIHKGKDHNSIMSGTLQQRIIREMLQSFRANYPEHAGN